MYYSSSPTKKSRCLDLNMFNSTIQKFNKFKTDKERNKLWFNHIIKYTPSINTFLLKFQFVFSNKGLLTTHYDLTGMGGFERVLGILNKLIFIRPNNNIIHYPIYQNLSDFFSIGRLCITLFDGYQEELFIKKLLAVSPHCYVKKKKELARKAR